MSKIQMKLLLGMVIMVLLTVASLWVYHIVFLEKNVFDQQMTTLQKHVEGAGGVLETHDFDGFVTYADDLFYQTNVSLELSTLSGEWLYTTGMSGRGHMMMGHRNIRGSFLDEVLLKGSAFMTTTNMRLQTDIFVYGLALNELGLVVAGSIPVETMNAVIHILQRQLFIITLVLVIMALVMSAFFARVFLKPIGLIDRSVRRIAEGDLGTRIDIASKDEFGTLARNFNVMAENLSRVESLRKDLVANISHELRTPLGLIKGYAELTRDIQGHLEDKRAQNMALIIDEADRLSDMVSGILAFSQMQSGYFKLNMHTVAHQAVLTRVFDLFQLAASEKGIVFEKWLCDSPIRVHMDEQRIEQVLHNFLSNAFRHTPSGGTIRLRSEVTSRGAIRVSVSDSGTGIAAASKGHIWEPYYRGTNADNGQGSGLGLSVAKYILEAHGFHYGVQSEEGKGSVFYFELMGEKDATD